MKKRIVAVLLMVCLLLPAYAKSGSGRRSHNGNTKTAQNVKKAAAQEAQKNLPPEPTHKSSNLYWATGYVDLSKDEKALMHMITLPEWYSEDEKLVILGDAIDEKTGKKGVNPVEKKSRLARKYVNSSRHPSEWFQIQYVLGLAKFFDENPDRARALTEEQSCYIRFMNQYLLRRYFNIHGEYRLGDPYHFKVRETLNTLNKYSLINAKNVFTSSRTDDQGITTWFDHEPDQKGDSPSERGEYVGTESESSNKGQQGGGGVSGGSQNGSKDGSKWGSPYGVPGGTKKFVPNACSYNGKLVYEPLDNRECTAEGFSA